MTELSRLSVVKNFLLNYNDWAENAANALEEENMNDSSLNIPNGFPSSVEEYDEDGLLEATFSTICSHIEDENPDGLRELIRRNEDELENISAEITELMAKEFMYN